jgi:hypothetical protein
MPVYLTTSSVTGRNLFATLKKLSDNTWWNRAASAWQANPSEADRKITLSEGVGDYLGSYEATVNGLGDDAWVRWYLHDGAASDVVVGQKDIYVWNGNEISSPGSEIIEVEAGADATGVDTDTEELYQGVDNRVLFTVTGTPTPNLGTWTGLSLHLRRTRNGSAFATLTVGSGLTVQATTNQVEAIVTAAHLTAGSISPLHKAMVYATLSGTSGYEYLTHMLQFRVLPTGLS